MDIDFLKKINDTHGHLAGDQVLQEFSRRIRTSIVTDHVVARYGGEEFAVVLADQTRNDARQRAEQLRSRIASVPCHVPFATDSPRRDSGTPQYWNRNGIRSTLRGLSKELIDSADQNLYKATNDGRNRDCG